MNYWLFKTEPDAFSIDDLAAHGSTSWEGVRNYQARNFLRQCAVGDEVFIYHSSCKFIGIAGVGKILRSAYADATQLDSSSDFFDAASLQGDPRWSTVDVGFVKKFPRLIDLPALKINPALSELALVKKASRLSVMPVSVVEYHAILAMC
jgi:predicted RNA-binding protein with PUA-like domain